MVNVADLRGEVERALREGGVKYVIAYERGTDGVRARPAFVEEAGDAGRVVWDPTCVHNLVRFLADERRRRARQKPPDARPVGLVVKGCDSRALVVLLQEKLISRGDVRVIGVSCESSGMADEAKVRARLAGEEPEALEFGEGGSVIAATRGGRVEIPAVEVLAQRCLECRAASPVIHDVLLGEPVTRTVAKPFGSLAEAEVLPQKGRREFWKGHLDRCIRCYACRSVCPMCYCDECVADSISLAVKADTSADEKAQRVRWVEKSPVTSENTTYHMVRAIHLAGRCVDCGECERACPVDIPLRLLNKKLEKAAKEQFGYEAGLDPDAPSLVSSFRDEDPGDFIG